MKSKIGIITIIDNRNYGNRLQNYALSHYIQNNTQAKVVTIKNRGFEDYTYIKQWDQTRFENYLRQTRLGDWLVRRSRIKRDKTNVLYRLIKKREKNFESFNQKYIEFTPYELCSYKWKHVKLNEFCLFITGSDQVWNPQFQRATKIDFLRFTESDKRIAYAASIGVSSIPQFRIPQFSQYVSEMKSISVREKTAQNLVEKYSNKRAAVVLDPTLLLSHEDWMLIAKKPDIILPQHYLLVYFLGKMSETHKNIITMYAQKSDLDILYLNDIKNEKLYVIGPDEFIYMFGKADAIFTDSYHGCVFSILFNKNFWVFKRDRYDIYSRIEDLLRSFDLRDREILDSDQHLRTIEQEEYTKVMNRIQTERLHSAEWLLSILKGYV